MGADSRQLEELAKGQPDDNGEIAGAWLDAYLDLQAAGLHWKKAAFVAWDNAPKTTRQPGTMLELAELLNYKSEQVLYKWRHADWYQSSGIERYRRSIFGKYLADVDRATIGAALNETGGAGVAARKLFYEAAGVMGGSKTEVTVKPSEDTNLMAIFGKMPAEELDQVIDNLQIATEAD